MNKTPDPADVVRDKVVPAAEELVASVAERVAPYAKEAVEQVSPVAQAAADRTVALVHAAAEKVAPLTHQAVEAVTPLAQQTREAVAPYAQQAADVVGPYAQTAADRVGPLAHSAAEAVAPYAALVREQGLKAGHDLADRLEPAYESAKEAAKEALSGARDKVTTDVLPAVGAAATSAAATATPLVAAAADRGKALVAGVRAEPPVVVVEQKKRGGWFRTLAIVAAAAGATYIVVRRLVGDRGSQWQTARPTTPYVPPTPAAPAPAATPARTTADAETDQQTGPSAHDTYRAADGAAEPDQPAEGGEAEVASTTSLYGVVGSGDEAGASDDTDAAAIHDRTEEIDQVAAVDDGDVTPATPASETSEVPGVSDQSRPSESDASGEGAHYAYSDEKLQTELETVEERAYEEPEDAVKVEQDPDAGLGPDAHPDRWDGIAGVYVGVEPPEGYQIKGNERSMKYHLPDSNSYARTIAQVWFASEEAAEQAGFTRAQH